MRRYWWPVSASSDLPKADSAPQQVRLLGEDFVLFRDSDGKLGLLDEYCPHRGVSLVVGRVEDRGIRCIYHGWKFGVDGKCQEMMNDISGQYLDRYKANAYPVREEAGLIWAYIGPKEKEPPFRRFAFMSVPESHRTLFRIKQNSNYLQLIEQGTDSSHVGVLHTTIARPTWAAERAAETGPTNAFETAQTVDAAQALGDDLAPSLEIEDTIFGYQYAAIRKSHLEGKQHIRVYPQLAPTTRFIPSGPKILFTVFEVPMDDEHTQTFLQAHGDRPLDREELKKVLGLDDPNFWSEETLWFNAPREKGYLQDRASMDRHWSGYPGVAVEDAIVGVAARPIADRTTEHLVPADLAVVKIRRVLMQSADAVEQGGDPIGVNFADCWKLVYPDDHVPLGTRWQDVAAANREVTLIAAE